MNKITVKVKIEVERLDEENGRSISYSHSEKEYFTEDASLEELAQLICYAIPKHDFPKFHVLEFYRDGKVVGHGES